jgi:hypothetical protein
MFQDSFLEYRESDKKSAFVEVRFVVVPCYWNKYREEILTHFFWILVILLTFKSTLVTICSLPPNVQSCLLGCTAV